MIENISKEEKLSKEYLVVIKKNTAIKKSSKLFLV